MTFRDPAESVTALDRAQARYSRQELLLRYARGRVAHVWMRQSMTVLGALVLWVSNGPSYAVAAVVLAVSGELVDCLTLRRIARNLGTIGDFHRAYLVSTLTAAFQATTIAGCIALGWFGPVSHSAPLFALAFLLGTTINAGLVLPYQRAASIARLVIYAVTLLVLLAGELVIYASVTPAFALNVGGATMLVYMAVAFLMFVNGSFEKNRVRNLETTRHSIELAQANDRLLVRERELKLLSLVARHANDSVIISNAQGQTSYVNDAFTQATGYSLEDIRGKRPRELLQFDGTDPAVLDAITLSARDGYIFRGEIQLAHKNGTPFWYEVNQVPVLNAEGRVETLVAVNRDVTEAKHQEEELLAAKRASENSARAKAEFLATMSHEIRTPMNGIIGMAELLCETDLDEDQKVYANTINGSAQGLLAIINDILDLSKLDAKKMSLAPVDFDLRACLESTVQLLVPQARTKDIRLCLDAPEDLPSQVHGDDVRLRQILLNLIGNAVKFTDKGCVEVCAALRTKRDDHLLSVSVTDTGVGIAPNKLAHVFERFSQAEASTTRRFGGTGLGLTISKLLAEAMGGDITVTSVEGQGSCFTLSMVLGRSDAKGPETSEPGEDTDLLVQIAGLRILVAEDNRVNRIVMEKYLTAADIDLAFATDGAEAVEMTRSFAPDLVFMDMSMPEIDGVEATRRIRNSDGPQPVIVALTANAFASDRAECLNAGMDGFLSKPVRRHDILDYLARHAQLREQGNA